MKRIWILLFFCIYACTPKASTQKVIRIGIDPAFPFIETAFMKDNVQGFLEDFLLDVSSKGSTEFQLIYDSHTELAKGLEREKYDLIFSNMIPYNFNENTYDFSEVFIPLAPYPVVRQNGKIQSLKDFKNKIIAIQETDLPFLDLKKHSDWNIKIYTSDLKALNDLDNGLVDVALIRYLSAVGYVEDTFYNKLELLDIPLTKQGYRFISLHGTNESLIKLMNQKFSAAKKDDKLLLKWDLKILQ